MKKLILLTLATFSLCAMDQKSKLTSKRKAELDQISHETFTQCKDNLPRALKGFITEFQNWPKEDKATISISGLSILISGLSKEKQEKYQGNLGYWIDFRTNQEPIQKESFIICLQYLKQQQK